MVTFSMFQGPKGSNDDDVSMNCWESQVMSNCVARRQLDE